MRTADGNLAYLPGSNPGAYRFESGAVDQRHLDSVNGVKLTAETDLGLIAIAGKRVAVNH